MACTISKVKHLFWYMVLVTAVVLLWSPQTMVTMMVASQHAPKNARENRQLRPSSYMKEEVNGGEEERGLNIDLNLMPSAGNVIGALNANEELVAEIPKAGEIAKDSANLLEWANSQGQLTEEFFEDAKEKILDFTTKYGRESVLSMLAAAKKDPATRDSADRLIFARLQDLNDGHDKNRLLFDKKKSIEDTLAEDSLQEWIKSYSSRRKKKSPFPLLYDKLSKHYGDRKLAQQLYILERKEGNDAVKKTANELAMHQITVRKKKGYSGDDLFKVLKLKEEGDRMLDSPLWYTWIIYFLRLKKLTNIRLQELAKLVVPELRNHLIDNDLYERFKGATSFEGKLQAEYNEKVLKEVQTKELETRKRKGNDDKALASIKRQREDDGQ
ncbi:hypothetical protein DD238_005302 [Peronospora effusa]|uniref:RxLR effector protein n=2 Tax=Peronospora effusa TaxID=542832 RepID=A0A3M6VN39_9STRA|nr:hypothetical protein DD238_005302 [Peronospora effusa]